MLATFESRKQGKDGQDPGIVESGRDRHSDARGELFAGDRRGAPTVLQPGEGAPTTGGIVRPAQPFASDNATILLLWVTISVWKCLNRNRNRTVEEAE